MSTDPERIIEFLREEAGRPLRPEELARELAIGSEERESFLALLEEMEGQGLLYRNRRQRYAAPDKFNLAVGRLAVIRSGAGFVVREGAEDDVFIPPSAMSGAQHGDRVVARIERRRGRQRPEGRVIRVLVRARNSIVGVYRPARNFGFVVPEDRKMTRDFFVPPGADGGAGDGDVVVLAVTSWGDDHRGPAGEVERVLGSLGEPGVDVLAILFGHELPLDFPPTVERTARDIAVRGIGPSDLEGRRDLRALPVFTIDPEDARDHDDALSIRPHGEGLWEVGVHIADVSHYVDWGSEMDLEARRRATSVYLVDRVVPMLPEHLSAGLCSLKPGEDRLALSLLLHVDDSGNVRDRSIVRSVIRSRYHLSYQKAQAVLDEEDSLDDAGVVSALASLARLADRLRSRREGRGSLDFDLPEARVVLGQEGEPIDIQRVLRLESHRLIEEFMLLANETVARLASESGVPLLFRVHEPPDRQRLQQLRDFLGTLGYHLPDKPLGPADLRKIIERVEGTPGEALVSTIILRSMRRAEYRAENLGHFGLAASHYTHFTSPIRRYPDLVVHRALIARFVDGRDLSPEQVDALPGIARTASDRERVAEEAERDSIDLKKVEFMRRHVGDDFDGTISGVTSFGFFVLLDRFFVEGLVHVSSLEDDYYVFIEERYTLQGERRRRRFQLGDRVRVRVAAVDSVERKIDFALIDAAV